MYTAVASCVSTPDPSFGGQGLSVYPGLSTNGGATAVGSAISCGQEVTLGTGTRDTPPTVAVITAGSVDPSEVTLTVTYTPAPVVQL